MLKSIGFYIQLLFFMKSKFDIDIQTINDLGLFGSKREHLSVFSLFNFTSSLGGKNRLTSFFESPLTDINHIIDRRNAIAFFQEITFKHDLDIDKHSLDFIEFYFLQEGYPNTPPSKFRAIEKALAYRLSPNNDYYIIERGIDYILFMLNNIYDFSLKISDLICPKLIKNNNTKIFEIFQTSEFREIRQVKKMEKLSALKIAKYDYMFRYTHKHIIRFFLDIIYDYDVFITVANVASANSYSFPCILSANDRIIEIEGLYNPFIKCPIKNNLTLTSVNNLLFITGANMSGKSSLLKSLAIVVYLAHLGFPVPATKAKISLLAGIFTTISIVDDIDLGYSHFYAEVSRIKYIIERLRINSNMLIIFDELFRGTNLKDAYDGSLVILSAFSQIKSTFFAISTHIVEVAKELKKIDSIQFQYMEMIKHSNEPYYTYKLKCGVSDDRMGMYIIDKERILDLIKTIS